MEIYFYVNSKESRKLYISVHHSIHKVFTFCIINRNKIFPNYVYFINIGTYSYFRNPPITPLHSLICEPTPSAELKIMHIRQSNRINSPTPANTKIITIKTIVEIGIKTETPNAQFLRSHLRLR